MFAGFNLEINDNDIEDIYYSYGSRLYADLQDKSQDTLDKYLNPDGSINATDLENDWFSSFDANIFISHSHNDEVLAIKLAGLLKKEYKLTSFIDSCVWGYANDLLKEIDNRYCKNIRNMNGSYSYNYDMRNYSTSHVHMILNGALAKMINNTECLFFLNTPNSIKTSDIGDKSKTASPWIYSELLMATEFPHQKLFYHRGLQHSQPIFECAESLQVEYDVSTDKLESLTIDELKSIGKNNRGLNLLNAIYLDKGLTQRKGR